jgi:hypothetical protein
LIEFGVRKGACPRYWHSSITPNCFDRTAGQRFFARGPLGFIFRLFADVGIGVFERAQEISRSQVTTDVAVNASAVDIERSGDVLFYAVVGFRHIRIAQSQDYFRGRCKTNHAAVAACFSSARHGGATVCLRSFSLRITALAFAPNSVAAV